jgi:ankyrin repeat protein
MAGTLRRPRFRWVACQIDALKNCLDYPRLQQALRNLPKTLDETYARILESIPKEHTAQTVTILNLLIWSDQTFNFYELVDAVATDVNEDPAFAPKNRMPVPRDILRLCSSLVSVAHMEDSPHIEMVQLAHFSVKEYLASNHVSRAFNSLISEKVARSYLAKLCLTHIVSVSRLVLRDQPASSFADLKGRSGSKFPFATYSAQSWADYAREAIDEDESLFKLVMSFFLEKHKADSLIWTIPLGLSPRHGWSTNLMWSAAEWGLTRVVEQLLDRGAVIDSLSGAALRVALRGGRDATVQLLLQRGARVNVEEHLLFQDAVSKCHDTTIKLLVERSAIMAAGNEFIMSLAVEHDRESIVRWLLDRGADVNAADGWSLSSNSAPSTIRTLQLLLDRGADVNAGDGRLLRQASRYGLHETVQLLLQRGANPNAHSQPGRTVLQETLEIGYDLLVNHLIVVDSRDTALASPQLKAQYKIAQLLLDHGADTNFIGREWLETLHAGEWSVHIVQRILERSAHLHQNHILSAMYDTDPQAEAITSVMLPYITLEVAATKGSFFYTERNLVHHAAICGSKSVMQRCLDLDVDIHAEDGMGMTALHLAAYYGHLTIVVMLVRAGSNVHAPGCRNRTPLTFAKGDVQYDQREFMEKRRETKSRHDIVQYLWHCMFYRLFFIPRTRIPQVRLRLGRQLRYHYLRRHWVILNFEHTVRTHDQSPPILGHRSRIILARMIRTSCPTNRPRSYISALKLGRV